MNIKGKWVLSQCFSKLFAFLFDRGKYSVSVLSSHHLWYAQRIQYVVLHFSVSPPMLFLSVTCKSRPKSSMPVNNRRVKPSTASRHTFTRTTYCGATHARPGRDLDCRIAMKQAFYVLDILATIVSSKQPLQQHDIRN